MARGKHAAPDRPKLMPDAARPDLCRGCMVCMLRCSLQHEREFAPSKAYLKVTQRRGAPGQFEVKILPSCDACGLCARHCPYGVIEMVEAGR